MSKIKYVTFKTSGQRGILVCERSSGENVLHMDSGVVVQLSTCAVDIDAYGFVLDVEVTICPVTSLPSFIIAFDILRIDANNSILKGDQVPDSTTERSDLLKSIVNLVQIKSLIQKPIYQSADAVELWGLRHRFPFPINGLIFLKQNKSKSAYKWKPPNDLTIHIVLYHMKEDNRFLPYIGPENFSLSYFPFYRFINEGSFEYSFRKESMVQGVIQIPTKMIRYQVDVANSSMMSRPTYHTRECTSVELQDQDQLVDVPPEYSCWAAYQVVEVKLDIETGRLRFGRLRRDKQKPNDIKEVDEIVHMSIWPTHLSDIAEELEKRTPTSSNNDKRFVLDDISIHATMNSMHEKQQNESLIPGIPEVLVPGICSYLAMEDLVSARGVAISWRNMLDSVERDYSRENVLWMRKRNHCYGQVFLNTLTLSSIGCFLHFGGRLK